MKENGSKKCSPVATSRRTTIAQRVAVVVLRRFVVHEKATVTGVITSTKILMTCMIFMILISSAVNSIKRTHSCCRCDKLIESRITNFCY